MTGQGGVMKLLNDRARCQGQNCDSRDTCERYRQRMTGGPQTPHYESMADGGFCGHYIETAAIGSASHD